VAKLQLQGDPAACVFANQTKLLLPRFLAKSVAVGDEITFPIPAPDAVGPEILVTKNAASGPIRYFYQAPIGYSSLLGALLSGFISSNTRITVLENKSAE
jgi:hypothetical protein